MRTRWPFRVALERRAQPVDVGDDRLGRQLDLPGRRAQHLGDPRLERAEVDRRAGSARASRLAVRARRSRPVGAGAQEEVERAVGAAAGRSSSARTSAGSRPASGDCGSATARWISASITKSSSASRSASAPWPVTIAVRRRSERHSGSRSGLGLHRRRRVVRDVAHGELVEREVVVRARERRRAGQDHVRVARRLVHVDVERDHEVERLECAVEALGLRRRDDRVARDRDERADLALARRLDLLGEADDRQLAERPRAGRARGSSSGRACTPLPVARLARRCCAARRPRA